MADFRRDFETVEEYHARLDREAAERATFEPDVGKMLDAIAAAQTDDIEISEAEAQALDEKAPRNKPTVRAKPLPRPEVIVKPGNHYARLAWKDGNEDEYANRMKARYGGEW